MAVLVGLAVGFLIAAGVAWSVYLIRVGLLDARDLAEKTAVEHPRSALHWPELRIGSVLPDPDEELVVVRVLWPAHPSEVSLLLLRLETASETVQFVEWCTTRAPITTSQGMGRCIEFRRRRTLQRVQALVVGESPG
jgi:hypothetical protein